ncbi:EAL domain-containing protein [Salinisphaera sp. Q1T1-3]|uniref:sensor domain-containing phosphodiesterase n=1 Tax=Salinisphaera sp. Q1T1-3 TaxID=2321229 RepID=UPI000E70D08D|nr:EAL domain-containing protein [Salinisphaera sp. Q1T1-3]RJS93085.1 EAL domain-containing protein [Salinisphaera sp. Q1T1-3]
MMKSSAYRSYALHSAFQPIFSLCHQRTVGFEALMRPHIDNTTPVSPLALMDIATTHGEQRELDTLCQTLHITNFALQKPERRWLFLNLDPNTVTRRWYDDGKLLGALEQAGIAPEEVVIELLEGRIDDEPALLEAINFFREMGAMVALDDFGAGHSNFDRLWRVTPDIIKLDRTLITEAEQHRGSRLRRILPNLVSLMHEAGSLVLCEGIETEDQAMVAMEADVDFVQGFYFGYPRDRIDHPADPGSQRLSSLSTRHASALSATESRELAQLRPYIAAFRAETAHFASNTVFPAIANALIGLPRTARVYLLNESGAEIDQRTNTELTRHTRAASILDSAGGIWYRRPYFRAAVEAPGQLQVSRPYLSSAGGYMCVTLSLATAELPRRVICCDVLA